MSLVLQNSSLDDMLDNEEQLSEQMDALPYLVSSYQKCGEGRGRQLSEQMDALPYLGSSYPKCGEGRGRQLWEQVDALPYLVYSCSYLECVCGGGVQMYAVKMRPSLSLALLPFLPRFCPPLLLRPPPPPPSPCLPSSADAPPPRSAFSTTRARPSLRD